MLGEFVPEKINALALSHLRLAQLPTARNSFRAEPSALPESIFAISKRWLLAFANQTQLLGECHQRLAVNPRRRGLYYTPQTVVNFILGNTVAKCDVLTNPYIKILDPACGCGYFLVSCYDLLWSKYQTARGQLINKYPAGDWSDRGIHRHIIEHNLWGADIDSVAVEITKFYLALKAAAVPAAESDMLFANILVCDSLIDSVDSSSRPRHRDFWSAAYDYVVGNPPYLSFGLRGTSQLDKDYADYLRRVYRASAEYKMSYYVLFMQRGIDMLKSKGLLGFIVPDSFLLGRYYSKIRRYILEHTNICSLTQIATPVFPQAAVGMSAICILQKKAGQDNLDQPVTIFQARTAAELSTIKPACSYQQNYFAALPHYRFRLFFDLTAKRLIDKIDSKGIPLGHFATGHTGVRSLTKQSDIIGNTKLGATWERALISGSQLRRYGFVYSGHWLNIDPRLLHSGGWQSEIVQQPKILLRQTGYDLVASIDDSGLYHLNNMHSFVACDDQISLEYLLMLINSRLMAFYYHIVSMEYNRPLAQTDIETIELLPVCVQPQIVVQAKNLVKVMSDCVARQLAGDKIAANNVARLDDYFNQIVYRVYDLRDEEIAYIEAYEQKIAREGKHKRRNQHEQLI